ncbi:hypothetical protein Ade02nite_71870 [Paractinoplanes deccanensis]|uniref:Lipoprotein n=1 Tax=Paractinoplanes deccanensis TaxID=113561 RepID=A0ABQ3YEV9_9ACTN|nr:DUF2927 domain-containing protein [Actinoplanes deccanensis]GID78546.1 hypothetical protein Ade02nite_71870 [Actinoplanes deccanensis]
MRPLLPMLLAASVVLTGCTAPAHSATLSHSPAASSPAPSPSVTTEPAPPPAPVKPTISKKGLDYFFTVALGAETGDKSDVVGFWNWAEVSVALHGADSASTACAKKTIADFNALTASTDLKLTTGTADIDVHIASSSKLRALDSDYGRGDDGYVEAQWSYDHVYQKGKVLIRSTGMTDRERCHTMRAELTQAMGFLNDSGNVRDSVLQDDYERPLAQYTALDKEVIRLLYSGALTPGDNRKTVTGKVTVK